MVLRVRLEMFGQVRDPVREESGLDLGRTGVGVVRAVLPHDPGLFRRLVAGGVEETSNARKTLIFLINGKPSTRERGVSRAFSPAFRRLPPEKCEALRFPFPVS